MKSLFAASVIALLAGCSSMGMSSGSSGYDSASHASGPSSYDEGVLRNSGGAN